MKIRSAASAALAVAAALILVGCANTTDSGSMPGMNHGSDSSASTEADFNNADVMFAQMMIPHHEQAIEMADMLLAKDGIDSDIVTLAEDIKAAQQPEIDQMEEWLQAWGADMGDMGGMGGMGHDDGMMSDDYMAAFQDATGAEASRLFLEQMIEHHEGAIDMAQNEVDNGQNADAIDMAESIIDTQTAEIAQMEQLLTEL